MKRQRVLHVCLSRRTLGALALSALLGFPLAGVEAQQGGTMTGRVVDATTLQPLASARVFVPGTTISHLTNAQGVYIIDNLGPGEVEVRVHRLGYATLIRTVQVSAGETLVEDFALQVSAVALDELVVTVTGPQRRRELGNSVVTVQAAQELERAAPSTLAGLLQGRAPGVQVLQSSGSVGTSSTIKIRGNTSINLDNTPLLFVDGTRVSNSNRSGPGVGGQNTSRLNDLILEDIESIEIVKGPSAATLYGAEAAAGVIRVTTKRGRTGLNEWTFRWETGANWDDSNWPTSVWNPRSFLGEVLDISQVFAPGTFPPGVHRVAIPDTLYTLNLLQEGRAGETVYGTPWRTGLEQTYGAGLRGGTENVTYYLSADYTQRDGSLPNNSTAQRSARANINILASERIDIALSAGLANNDVFLPDNDNNAFGYLGVGLLGSPWAVPIRRTDPLVGGEWITCPLAFELGRAITRAGIAIRLDDLKEDCGKNPFFSERTFDDVATLTNSQRIERFIGSTTIDYRPLPFLTARATAGYDEYSDQTSHLVPVNPDLPFGNASLGERGSGLAVIRTLTVDGGLMATFDLMFGLRSTTSLGGQFLRGKSNVVSAFGRVLPPGGGTVSSAVRTEGFEAVSEGRTLGYYLEQQIAYRDRLFLTPAVRVDDSSAFGDKMGSKVYPRLMGSYLMGEEDWFSRLVPGRWVESLRLRGAWGKSGKQPGSFAALQILGPTSVTFRGDDVAGLAIVGPGNPDLRPETAREIEFGFEADLLAGRLGIDFTRFHKVTQDAFVARPLPPSTGFSAAMPTNIGEIKSVGMELGLSAVALNMPNLRWDWSINWSSTKGEVTKLEDPIIYGLGGNSQRHQQGYPFGAYFSQTYSIQNGEAVASDSMVFVGHPTPEVEGSVSSSLMLFRGVTLHAIVGFARGFQQFNSTQEFRCGFLGGGTYGGVCSEIFEKGGDGQPTDQAKIKAAAAADQQVAPWIEDASFARLRSVSARFELPRSWIGNVRASRASFTIEAQNLALFTNYTGLDPEVNFAGGAQATRAEFLTLPPGKRVVGRLSITF